MNSAIPGAPPLSATLREIISVNPATLEELGRVPILTETEVQSALIRAREAQPAWAALAFRERAKFVLRAKNVLVDCQDNVCELIARESGKPALEALTAK
jgi:acyl-CoA reductase-like NAD-dependent aldehyde dehydrogenase